MTKSKKPKVAFFDFAGCEGDQLQIANLEEKLIELTEYFDIVEFREIIEGHRDDYEIAFIEGSCTRPSDEERLRKIRQQAGIVVAIGACATIGGVNSLRNNKPLAEIKAMVYGKRGKNIESYEARPIDAVIPVDYKIHGCPIRGEEFLELCKALLMGQKYSPPNYPVCVECKLAENVCVFEKGMSCVGPVTRAGCQACCVTQGAVCWGCRGLLDDPNTEAHKEVLSEYGLSVQEIINRFDIYFRWQETTG